MGFLRRTFGKFICLDSLTGKKLWDHDFKATVSSPPIVTVDNILILGVEGDGKIFAINQDTGKIRGEIAIPPTGYQKIVLAGDGKTVMAPSKDGNLYAIGVLSKMDAVKEDFKKALGGSDGYIHDNGNFIKEIDDVVIIGGVMLPVNKKN